jgi:hypothetical protein
MRNLAFSVLVVAAVSAGIGCGGGSTRKLDGGAGSTGSAGSTAGTIGTAGTGVAGSTTGTAGAGGDTGAAGTGGSAAGAGGTATAGTGGTGGTGGEPPPPPPPYCDMAGMTKKPLPYKIGADFSFLYVLQNNGEPTYMQWKVVPNPNCDVDPTTLPALYTPPVVEPSPDAAVDAEADGGIDATSDAGTDAAADTSTLALDPDGGDGGVDAAADTAPVDAPVDVAADASGDAATDGGDGGTDAVASTDGGGSDGPKAPACYEFTYVPDPCLAGGGVCWGGVILTPPVNASQQAAGPGICIGDGAMHISFMAKGSRASARIKWGSTRPGEGSTETFLTTLTKDWVQYSIIVPAGELYNTSANPGGVWNGFSVVAEPQDHMGGTYIFVKDITWTAN